MDQLLATTGMTAPAMHHLVLLLFLVAVAGTVFVMFWKTIVVGGLALAGALIYLKTAPPPTDTHVDYTPGVSVQQATSQKQQFIASCVASGVLNGECTERWAEQQYQAVQKAGEEAENAAANNSN
jgi:hypothetical protein